MIRKKFKKKNWNCSEDKKANKYITTTGCSIRRVNRSFRLAVRKCLFMVICVFIGMLAMLKEFPFPPCISTNQMSTILARWLVPRNMMLLVVTFNGHHCCDPQRLWYYDITKKLRFRFVFLAKEDRTCWAVVHGDCYVTIIVFLHTTPAHPNPLLCNDHRGPRLNKYDGGICCTEKLSVIRRKHIRWIGRKSSNPNERGWSRC